VAEALPLSDAEFRLLASLLRHKIRFMVVGLSAASIFHYGEYTVGDVKRFFGGEEYSGAVVKFIA
jgi:hypothetical protein